MELLQCDLLLELLLDAADLHKEDFSVDHVGLLGHCDEIWQTFKLHLGDGVRTQALFVFLEKELKFLQFNLQDLDVLEVPVTLLF